jgi:hypothetical protein
VPLLALCLPMQKVDTSTTSSRDAQEEKEEEKVQVQELATLQDLTAKEAGYEGLAAWVGAAMAFGAGIWYMQVRGGGGGGTNAPHQCGPLMLVIQVYRLLLPLILFYKHL